MSADKMSVARQNSGLADAARILSRFIGTELTTTIADIERRLQGRVAHKCAAVLHAAAVDATALNAAAHLKRAAGQINVVIHALGILSCLPHLLQPDETVTYASLGAGNTGRAFDLETDQRIAEFKFIRWQGRPESIRQNALFKDFYLLARQTTAKAKHLYVLGTDHPLRFFNGRRDLRSVLSRNVKLRDEFFAAYGARYRTVRDYYEDHKGEVTIADVSPWVPALVTEEPTEDLP